MWLQNDRDDDPYAGKPDTNEFENSFEAEK